MPHKIKKVLTPNEQKIVKTLWEVEKFFRNLQSYDILLKEKYRQTYPFPGSTTPDDFFQKQIEDWKYELSGKVFELAHEIQGTKDQVIDIDFKDGKIIKDHPYKK